MAKIILFPTHENYCRQCIYDGKNGECTNEEYIKNGYKVNCVWKYCPYRKEKRDGSAVLEFTMCHVSGREIELIVEGCLQLGFKLGMFDSKKEED